jgi:hypothetical protein
MPPFTLDKTKYTSTMRIGPWTIIATKKPILNGKEIDAWVHKWLCGADGQGGGRKGLMVVLRRV